MRRLVTACRHAMVRPFIYLVIALFCLGCEGQKPEKIQKVAVQGLICGALSDNAKYAVVGSVQHGGSLWSTANAERRYNWNHQTEGYSTFRAAGMAGNGKVAVTVVDADIVVWDVTTGRSLNFWRAPDKIMALAVDQQGHYAILGLQNSLAVYFDLQRGLTVHEFQHEAEVFGVSLSRNGELAMTGSDDRTARIWRLSDGALLHKFKHGNQVKTVALSADGKLAFSTAQREDAVIWDVVSGDAKARLNFRYENYTSARFTEDSSKLLVGTFRGDIYMVNTSNGEKLKYWTAKPRQLFGPASSAAILDVAVNDNGNIIALSSDGLLQYFSP
jgi:tricorn protease-like protein